MALFTARSGGNLWWRPVAVIWGLSIAGYGLGGGWIWRREGWEDETRQQRARFFAPSGPFSD